MKFTQILTAITFFVVYSTSLVIVPRYDNNSQVKAASLPVIDPTDNSLVQGLEDLIPTVVSTIFKALGESEDKLSSVIPNVLSGLNLTSIDAQPLIAAATNDSSAIPPSNDPALVFISEIVNETFKVLGVSSSTIILNLPGIISTFIKIFSLTVPDIVTLFVGIASGNPLSIGSLIKLAGDAIQAAAIGAPEAISIIQQIIQKLTAQ